MEIDQATGVITFTPAAGDVGTRSVVVQVSDGRGGLAQQSYVLTVANNVPNRPPVFTSSPVVDANVNTLYQYQPETLDADDDPLVFSLTTAPSGMAIDSTTGIVTWTPSASQLGENAVKISGSDGRGGSAEQSFTVVVQQEAGNHAPIIISEPVTQFVLPAGQLLGPLPYLSHADSPFDLSGLGTSFFLEDFEDHLFNVPGVSADNGGVVSVVFGPGIHDSVDADDGIVDGSGLQGDDWFSGSGHVRFTFDPVCVGRISNRSGPRLDRWRGRDDDHFRSF